MTADGNETMSAIARDVPWFKSRSSRSIEILCLQLPFIHQVAVARRQRSDLSFFESSLPSAHQAATCWYQTLWRLHTATFYC